MSEPADRLLKRPVGNQTQKLKGRGTNENHRSGRHHGDCHRTATAPANAASTCRGVAKHIASGSVVLEFEPVRLVPARSGRCLLILSGWAIQADSEVGQNLYGSGSVNIGDESIDSSGTGGFVPPDQHPLELATEDEVWAVTRQGHLSQVITWIELFD